MGSEIKPKTWLGFIRNNYKDDDLIFFKFAILWFSFNCYLNEKYSITGDHKKIRKFSNNKNNSTFFTNLKTTNKDFDNWLKKFKDTKNGGRNYVINMDTINSEKGTILVFFDGSNNTCYDYFEVIYQIRCNYLHGEKLPYDKDDRSLVDWAFWSLYIFWKDFLK